MTGGRAFTGRHGLDDPLGRLGRTDAGFEVAGPVPTGVLGPLHGGVDVEAEQVGEDRRGQLGGQGDQRGAAGAADVGDVGPELAVEGVAGRSAGEATGEQPGGTGRVAALENRNADGVKSLAVEEGGDGGRQEERLDAEMEERPTVAAGDVVGSQLGDAADGEAVEEGQGAAGPGVEGQALVGEAVTEMIPALVLTDRFERALCSWLGDVNVADQACSSEPADELPGDAPLLRGWLSSQRSRWPWSRPSRVRPSASIQVSSRSAARSLARAASDAP